ncbi:MAG: hypothetical protein KF760_07515 [Candidatus Eremiobacteraeota bacterium]|nr:hypothetical protein [Candidatus Eremiobacteraeota bacterium]MCW5869748.1 hypothetical protein [Candidatus Eremiobacteraeota bacterium]
MTTAENRTTTFDYDACGL